jgi:hypothetical protein
MSRWFRLHDELLDDPAVGLLPDKYFKTWISLLCAVSKHGPSIIKADGFAKYIRVSKRHLTKALALFKERGLVVDGQIKHFRTELARLGNSEWSTIRGMVFERDNYTCAYCGERGGKLECDHIIPHSRGGSDEMGNLTTACFSCNRSKRAKTPEEWRAAQQ